VSDGPQRERKVVTVLFADLVGFTSRAESLDPEDVHAILRPYHDRLRSELERHGGTVEKFIGDAVMALFGAPIAHDDDPERAVRAALAIRDWARDEGALEVRIGVTTGEALVSLAARPEAGEGMASGDVVNTAARLQSAAPVNGVFVDETTFRATERAIEYRDHEPVQAKGKSEAVGVWEPVQARSRIEVDVRRPRSPLVGRTKEVDVLADALARVQEGRSVQLVTIVGEPGIGKSRLIWELLQRVEADPGLFVYWRQGRSLPYGEGINFWSLSEMVKTQAGILETDSPEAADAKLRAAVASMEDADWLARHLRTLLGLGGEAELGKERRDEAFTAWRRFLEELAEERPLVVVFEDLHWADDGLLDFVDHLVDWSSGVPILVVASARPDLLERRPGWAGGKRNATTISPAPLTDEETAKVVAALLERPLLSAETQAQLLRRAGGNPLYAEEFARMLAERGATEQVPETLQGLIGARLDGLSLEEKGLLQRAAVVGRVFWLGTVEAMNGASRRELEQRLHALERQEAAEWIESLGRSEGNAEMLAHHYLEALKLRRAAGQEEPAALVEQARAAARDAGDRAFGLGSLTPAKRFYEAALELSPPDDEARPELLLAYARSRVDDSFLDESVLTEAIDGLLARGRAEEAAEGEARLAGIWLIRGDRERALEHLELGRELVAERGPSPAKAFVLQELARVLMMGEDERAIEIASESLRLAEELGLDATRARNLNTIGSAKVMVLGDPGGIADLERAIEIGVAANSHEQVSARANLQVMIAALGDLRRADELQKEALAEAKRLGVTSFVRWQEGERMIHAYSRGKWDEAVEGANAFLGEVEAGEPHYMESNGRFVRGAIELARGNVEAALADARRGTEAARAVNDPQLLNPALAFEARVELAAGNLERANRLADELVAAWGDKGMRPLQESVDGAWLLVDLGRRDELEAAIERYAAKSRWHEGAARIAAGELVAAAESYAEIGSVPEEAYARLRAAQAFVRSGRRAEADAQLRLALPVFASLRASAWQAEAESLLAASA